MMIALHKNARTTPAIRAEMATSSQTAATLALSYGVSESTFQVEGPRQLA
jgi:hypothetical protein